MALGLPIAIEGEDCICYQQDTFTEWKDVYCVPEYGGQMMQERMRYYYVSPACDTQAFEVQYQKVSRDYCKICNPPTVLSDWKEVGCSGGKNIFERQLKVELFDPTVSACYLKDYKEIKTEPTDVCIITNQVIDIGGSIMKIWFVPVVLLLGYYIFTRIWHSKTWRRSKG